MDRGQKISDLQGHKNGKDRKCPSHLWPGHTPSHGWTFCFEFNLPQYSWNLIPNSVDCQMKITHIFFSHEKLWTDDFSTLDLFLHNIAPWPPNETEWWTVTRQGPDLTYLSNGTRHHLPSVSSPGIIFSDLVYDGFSWYPVGGNAWRAKSL